MENKLKYSGQSWIGDIPESWNVQPIGSLFSLRNQKVSDNNFMPLSVTKRGILPQLDNVAKSNAHDDRKLVRKGDFVINSRSDRRGSCGISSYDGSVSLINIVLKPLSKEYSVCPLVFSTIQFSDEFYRFGHGIVDDLWTTGWQEMKKIMVPVPPKNEQTKINNFLNARCGEIDNVLHKLYSQLEYLEKYKRSFVIECAFSGIDDSVKKKTTDVEWLKRIPEHWQMKRGKYFLTLLSKPVKPNDGVVTCFRDGEVTLRSNRREEGFTMADKEIGYQGIDVGDLVVHGMDGFAGAIGISDSRGKASPVLNVLATRQNKKYIMYYLRALAYSDVFLAMATGIRVRSCDLRWTKLADLMYPLPPLDEQEKIVDYIEEKVEFTNKTIRRIENEISSLEKYKKSLIYEYVTGKKEVPANE